MERLNEVRVIGNVGTIKERDTSTYLAIALNESYKKKDSDEWTENTVWIDVVAFNPVIAKIHKAGIGVGDAVLIVGKLNTRMYEEKRTTQIIAQKVQLIQKAKKSNGNTPPAEQTSPVDADAGGQTSNGPQDDDLPF